MRDAARSRGGGDVAFEVLLRAHAASGKRAAALRVLARWRRLFRDELGAFPPERTTDTLLAILRSKG